MVYPNTATNTFTNGTTADADEVNANFTNLINGASALGTPVAIGMSPVGSIVAWHKTFGTVDSGTADTNTLNALEDSGADFIVDGVKSGMIVFNSTDGNFAIADVVTATKVTLKADANADSAVVDTFPLGTENYTIYATPELPDNWVELNGQTISDSDSPYNGIALPNLHTAVEDTHGRFLRGVIEGGLTGQTEGSANLSHTHQVAGNSNQAGGVFGSVRTTSAASNHGFTGAQANGGSEARPVSFTVVWIMRIK
jgi:hypothetical protein